MVFGESLLLHDLSVDGGFLLTGGYRISQVVAGAHEGGIFSLCVLKDGTLVSGGGKDRKVVLWDHEYHKQNEMVVWQPHMYSLY